MLNSVRWIVRDRDGNEVYLTQERWDHIIRPAGHPELVEYEEELKETIRRGTRKQDIINPQKYRYMRAFNNLTDTNTHIVAIVLNRFKYESGKVTPNNYIVTAYQIEKE